MSKILQNRTGAGLALGFAIALAPALAAKMPPIMDFPNHLARIWLMAGGAGQPPLDSTYRIDIAKAGANVGVDLAAAALAHVLPIFVVGKILVALAFLGPPLGGVLLNRALVGKFHPLQLAFLALAWSTTAIAGFVNFQISLGLALLFAAVVSKQLDKLAESLAFHLIFSTILLFVHPLGLAFYALTILALLFGPEFDGRSLRARLGSRALALFCAAATPVVVAHFVWRSSAKPPLPFWGDAANIVDPIHILTILLSPILSYNLTGDLVTTVPIVAIIVYALVARRAKLHAGLTLAAGALFALSPLAPDAIGDGSWLPQRFPIMAALMFLAGLRPRASSERRLFLAAVALPVLGRALWIGWVWMARQSDVAGLLQAMRAMPPGASMITLQQETPDWRAAPVGRFMIGSPNGVRATGRHLGALAVIEAQAFVPTLFSVPGQHALVVRPPWREIAVEASSIPYPRQLGTALSGDPYLKDWRIHFDYVLVLNADLPAASDFDPAARAGLEPIADRGFAKLYKVTKPAPLN